jgi:hypothetical protein
MGVLTESMLRLRGEIGAWRHERVILQHDLSRQVHERRIRVSALRATFARDCAGAHRAWFGPTLSERRAEEAEARTQREHEQRRLAEEARTKAQREQQALAAAKSQPQVRNQPVAVPSPRPPTAPMAQAQKKAPFKGSNKH